MAGLAEPLVAEGRLLDLAEDDPPIRPRQVLYTVERPGLITHRERVPDAQVVILLPISDNDESYRNWKLFWSANTAYNIRDAIQFPRNSMSKGDFIGHHIHPIVV